MESDRIKAWDRTAKNYFEEVLSPFSEGVENPIFWYVESKIENSKKKDVIDVGTGIGNALPFLSKKFHTVLGIDISPKMVKIAKERIKNVDNVKILERDATDLEEFYNSFDVAVAVNSILLPEISMIEKMLFEIHKTLKSNGIFIGVFPSMENILYRAVLENEKARQEGYSEKTALIKAMDAIEAERCDFISGTFEYNDMVQKHYYRFELKYRLKKAGFKNVNIRKVYYPWEIYEKKDLEEFHNKPKPWDWFVFAEKSDN